MNPNPDVAVNAGAGTQDAGTLPGPLTGAEGLTDPSRFRPPDAARTQRLKQANHPLGVPMKDLQVF